jgi:hypothetical protein
MSSAFRSAVEAEDLSAALAQLADDVEFRSPAVHRPYRGKDATGLVLGAVFQAFQDFRYTASVREDDREVLMFEARVGDRDIQGADFIRYDRSGLIKELTVMIRPLSGLNAVVEAVGAHLKSLQEQHFAAE